MKLYKMNWDLMHVSDVCNMNYQYLLFSERVQGHTYNYEHICHNFLLNRENRIPPLSYLLYSHLILPASYNHCLNYEGVFHWQLLSEIYRQYFLFHPKQKKGIAHYFLQQGHLKRQSKRYNHKNLFQSNCINRYSVANNM